ncbi:hypothetical protein [Streptomyces sp. NPDC007205]
MSTATAIINLGIEGASGSVRHAWPAGRPSTVVGPFSLVLRESTGD